MIKTVIKSDGVLVAVIHSESPVVIDAQSALDLMADVRYSDDCDRIAINKKAFAEDFFRLSTGIAGEIIQKFINYSMKIAIIGDFTCYTSKPLEDFIRESNRGSDVFFVPDEQTAIEKLSRILP